jgi:hypothetical protein
MTGNFVQADKKQSTPYRRQTGGKDVGQRLPEPVAPDSEPLNAREVEILCGGDEAAGALAHAHRTARSAIARPQARGLRSEAIIAGLKIDPTRKGGQVTCVGTSPPSKDDVTL